MPAPYLVVTWSSMSLALSLEPPETAFWGIRVWFLVIAGGPRDRSEDVNGITGGFVSVTTGVLDGVLLGVFEGVAPGFISITRGMGGASGEMEQGAGQVSRESGSLAFGLEQLGFSCSDSRVTPTGWGAGAGAGVGMTQDIWMDCCMWRNCSVRYCTNSRWHGVAVASVKIGTISICRGTVDHPSWWEVSKVSKVHMFWMTLEMNGVTSMNGWSSTIWSNKWRLYLLHKWRDAWLAKSWISWCRVTKMSSNDILQCL